MRFVSSFWVISGTVIWSGVICVVALGEYPGAVADIEVERGDCRLRVCKVLGD